MDIYYMNGAGNDFMVIDARNQTPDFPALAKALCARTGADGFMAVDHSEKADFRLHFYNSDGSRGEMCGNGARCICRFAHEIGLAGDAMVVEADAGLVPGWRLDETNYRIGLNLPSVLDLNRTPDAAYVELGCPGLPHAVVAYEGDLWQDREALRERMRVLRFHPAFPKGANVNFYQVLAPGEVRLLTYERGVEDFTLACGSGSGSTGAVLWARGLLPGGKLIAHNPGGTLGVTVVSGGATMEALLLEGPTEITKIFRE